MQISPHKFLCEFVVFGMTRDWQCVILSRLVHDAQIFSVIIYKVDKCQVFRFVVKARGQLYLKSFIFLRGAIGFCNHVLIILRSGWKPTHGPLMPPNTPH